jgi:hypothetical protein
MRYTDLCCCCRELSTLGRAFFCASIFFRIYVSRQLCSVIVIQKALTKVIAFSREMAVSKSSAGLEG